MAILVALAACGGGAGSTPAQTAATTAGPAIAAAPLVTTIVPSTAAPTSAPGAPSADAAALAVALPSDPTAIVVRAQSSPSSSSIGMGAPPAAVTAAAPVSLASLRTNPGYTSAAYGPTAACRMGYLSAGAPSIGRASAVPASGGVTHSVLEVAKWRANLTTGPFVSQSDYARGSPGDASRILRNAATFLSAGEPLPMDPEAVRMSHGTLARDAAFVLRTQDQVTLLPALRSYLLSNATDPRNDFRANCFVNPADQPYAPDAYLGPGDWLLRYTVTYDFLRPLLADVDRLVIERYLLAQAHYLAAHADWYLAQLFPNRLAGDYRTRLRWAAGATDADRYFSARVDTNGDCVVDASDDVRTLPIYAYVRSDGTSGPRITQLSRMYNNRRSVTMAAVGIVGEVLSDAELINRGKRYFMEWLTYSVYPDGSQGEYERGGDYCIAKQGVIYSHLNTQSALFLAKSHSRRGDRDLYNFGTRDGLFGTEVGSGNATPKSLASAVQAAVELANGQRDWYLSEPWKSVQVPRPTTFMGALETNFMARGAWIDSFNELGYLASSEEFASLHVREFLMRIPGYTSARFPGSTGLSVGTGAGTWTDAMNAMPAVFLLNL